MLRAELFEIAIATPDLAAMRAFYAGAMGYDFDADAEGIVGSAGDRRIRLVGGRAGRLVHAAYALEDEPALRALGERLTGREARPEPISWNGGEGLAVLDPDGNRLLFTLAQRRSDDGKGESPKARLQHAVFATADPERLLAFYTKAIGFRLSDRVEDSDNALRAAFLRSGSEHHSLALFRAAKSRLDHHCYETDGWICIRDWADRLASFGVPIKWGPGRHGPGNNLFLFVEDPDGNRIEISAELAHVAPDAPAGLWPHEERTLNLWGAGMLRS